MFMRSFARHFNETVFRGPETEGGTPEPDIIESGGDVGGGDEPLETEGGEEPRLTVREQLKKSMAEVAAENDKPQPTVKDKKSGRFQKKEETTPPAGQQAAPAAPAVEAPTSLSKEAKEQWANTPPAVQAAFVKREQDMQAGVEQLQQRYALIDQAIAPHTDALRQMNATPGEAVNRMFLWFKALAGNPRAAFPELAKSMGMDLGAIMQAQQAQQAGQQVAGQQQPGQQQAPEAPPPYVQQLEQRVAQLQEALGSVSGRFGNVEQSIQSQNEARTRENLTLWSKDKPHFEAVRMDMAQLIQTGIVPLKPDGQVDLDTAYERAIYFNPEVRAKVLAEQQQADLKAQETARAAATTAQQQQVSKARKASVSIPAAQPPGAPAGAKPGQKPQRTNVRDSLKAAIAELRDQ